MLGLSRFLLFCVVASQQLPSGSSMSSNKPDRSPASTSSRMGFLQAVSTMALMLGSSSSSSTAYAFAPDTNRRATTTSTSLPASPSSTIVAYQDRRISLPEFGVDVPVAIWFQPTDDEVSSVPPRETASYAHRISVKRIGGMLANLDFIPGFVARDFALTPTTDTVVRGDGLAIPSGKPVVLLAHGFLGSRFDLSHLAEALASEGFVCVGPEYPESLAASYDRIEGLDRATINDRLLGVLPDDWGCQAKCYGIVGHSLGCGTATSTGDASWTRVCLAGPPVRRDGMRVGGSILAIASLNDGLVTRERLESMLPPEFVRLQESTLTDPLPRLPARAALILDRDDAPNHISFLAGNANDAMVSFLSPLLPVAQALSIPVLDFDKYQESRDSEATARVVIPLVSAFLQQNML